MTRQIDNILRLARTPIPNTGLAKVAVQLYADSFVVNQTLVLRINPEASGCWKSPPSQRRKTCVS